MLRRLLPPVFLLIVVVSRSAEASDQWEHCLSDKTNAALFIAKGVAVNQFNASYDRPITSSCAPCVFGEQYKWRGRDYHPQNEYYHGMFVSVSTSCPGAPSDLCVETTDGRLWQGFAPENRSIILHFIATCNKTEAVCTARALVDGRGVAEDDQEGWKTIGLRSQDGEVTTVYENWNWTNPVQWDQGWNSFAGFDFLRVTGVSCNACRSRLAYCYQPKPTTRRLVPGQVGVKPIGALTFDKFASAEHRLGSAEHRLGSAGHSLESWSDSRE